MSYLDRLTPRQRHLIECAERSEAKLKSEGFEKVSSFIAGIESGSDWDHKDGRKAHILVKNMNSITYDED